ncbi:MAG: molybdopterin biosynthesis protein [Bacillota bacterium]
MQKVYLSNTPRREALEIFLNKVDIPRRLETLPTGTALGRVTGNPVFAALSMPGYHAAAMDGIAVRAESTFGASDQNPLRLLPEKGYAHIDTGDPLPAGCDAVIKIEDIQPLDGGTVEILAPAVPWQHVRPVGEDVVAGELIVPAYHRLRPADLGALLAGGISSIEVLGRPRAAVIPTGSEVVPAGAARENGSIPDFNSTVIAAYLREWGAEPVTYPIVPDEPDRLREALARAAAETDLVIINAGSSAGRDDYTARIMGELGEVLLHGVATRPGKPTILGRVAGKPVVGLPGYPVSAYFSLEWFVRPLLYRYQGRPEPERERLTASLGRRVVSEMGVEEHVRMTVGNVGGRFIANPLTRGAGVTMSLVRADGLLIVPENSLGFEQDEPVELELYRPAAELRHNLLAAGSHDLIIDLLATALKEKDHRLSLSSAHLGSMGGITAIGKRQAHLAGVHLFDPESGDYNLPFIRRLLPDRQLYLVTLAYRMQGWIVPKGNPDRVKDIRDICSKKLSYINRQKGAGTRLLFDHLLKEAHLSPAAVYGYQREEHTHLNVAAAVAAGTGRAGLGILPAARAFGLDFIPVTEERYDLLMEASFYRSGAGEALLAVIADPLFRRQVEAMGGYCMREAGQLRSER